MFDFDATHFFISVKLVETPGLVSTYRPPLLSVTLPDGKTVKCDELYRDYPIQMYEHEFWQTYISFS